MDEGAANLAEIAYWNGPRGECWAALHERVDAMVGPIAAAAHGGIGPGQRVIDVGCGSGGTSLELGQRVGPAGWVLGVDVSRPMLGRARARARERGATSIEFREADAQTAQLPRADLVHSRFGVVFFDDPAAAFPNLRAAVSSGGRLAVVIWQEPEHNPWLTDPIDAVSGILEAPESSDPGGPGPFSLSDPANATAVLREAGWSDIELEGSNQALCIGQSVEDAVDFCLGGIGPVAALAADADDDARAAAAEALTAHYSTQATANGVFAEAAAWIIRAAA